MLFKLLPHLICGGGRTLHELLQISVIGPPKQFVLHIAELIAERFDLTELGKAIVRRGPRHSRGCPRQFLKRDRQWLLVVSQAFASSFEPCFAVSLAVSSSTQRGAARGKDPLSLPLHQSRHRFPLQRLFGHHPTQMLSTPSQYVDVNRRRRSFWIRGIGPIGRLPHDQSPPDNPERQISFQWTFRRVHLRSCRPRRCINHKPTVVDNPDRVATSSSLFKTNFAWPNDCRAEASRHFACHPRTNKTSAPSRQRLALGDSTPTLGDPIPSNGRQIAHNFEVFAALRQPLPSVIGFPSPGGGAGRPSRRFPPAEWLPPA